MEGPASSTAVRRWILQRERIRKLRMQRHLAVALLNATMLPFVAPTYETFPGFVLVLLLVCGLLDSLGRAVDARIGYLWGWLCGEPEQSTRMDLIVDTIIRRLAAAGRIDEEPAKVRPI